MNTLRRIQIGLLVFASLTLLSVGCDQGSTTVVPGISSASKSIALLRASRRAYDGAPPVIPHQNFGSSCSSCHNESGMAVPNIGFAPPTPHEVTSSGKWSRCRSCHVFRSTEVVFRESSFEGLPQDLRPGKRYHDLAPPVIPHQTLLRENCNACHSGPAAREEIRCTHPERPRCVQCHAETTVAGEFTR